ncbi:DUF4160 domain-containing protein [Marivita hallyeonensis]|uniref:DUF4160 domain-containing protein n=1 Tax=Marivita hallyeonensis TaxID=996342 RepID=A0A1M5NMC5_9RHOB|nr:DUF4160 domain-containing protein [Marivita hallyeonensis]SHG90662.1 protein of unknown function [Marivita hallyeonensis]
MPTVFRQQGYRFFFYSNEGDPREPIHIHVTGGGGEAKIWLHPVKTARYHGFDFRTLRTLMRIVEDKAERIEEAWNEHFGD